MKVAYSPCAVADLMNIAEHSHRTFGAAVAAVLDTTIRATVVRIAATPEIGRRLAERPQVRVVLLVRYPFKIFYTFNDETITILHIRHAARRPWRGE